MSHLDIDKRLSKYIGQHSSQPDQVLVDLERTTHLKTLAPQMISGHIQGRILSMISHMIRPQCVLEIGTFTGYATLCLAEGLAAKGTLHTIESNLEYQPIIEQALHRSERSHQIIVHYGNALELIPSMPPSLDLVFIDAAKVDYVALYHLVIDKVASNGYILADNVLWSGKVVEQFQDLETKGICAFNKLVQEDTRVDNVILTVRDGLMLCRKR